MTYTMFLPILIHLTGTFARPSKCLILNIIINLIFHFCQTRFTVYKPDLGSLGRTISPFVYGFYQATNFFFFGITKHNFFFNKIQRQILESQYKYTKSNKINNFMGTSLILVCKDQMTFEKLVCEFLLKYNFYSLK